MVNKQRLPAEKMKPSAEAQRMLRSVSEMTQTVRKYQLPTVRKSSPFRDVGAISKEDVYGLVDSKN